jgi:uncharacterized protein with LGFP repeats
VAAWVVVAAVAAGGADLLVGAVRHPLDHAASPILRAHQQPVPVDPIDAEYAALGGPTGPLGPATGDELDLPQHAGRFRPYSTGSIIWTPAFGAVPEIPALNR